MRPSSEGDEVFTGASASLLLHPSEFIESRNEAEAMSGPWTVEMTEDHEVLGVEMEGV
jgi:hypothetical protein